MNMWRYRWLNATHELIWVVDKLLHSGHKHKTLQVILRPHYHLWGLDGDGCWRKKNKGYVAEVASFVSVVSVVSVADGVPLSFRPSESPKLCCTSLADVDPCAQNVVGPKDLKRRRKDGFRHLTDCRTKWKMWLVQDDRELMSRNKWFTRLNIKHRILSTRPLVWANCPKRCIHTIHFLLDTKVHPLPVGHNSPSTSCHIFGDVCRIAAQAANSCLTPESTITVYCLTRLVISPEVLIVLIFPSSSSNRLPSQGWRGCYTTRHLKLLSFLYMAGQ